MNNTLAFNEVLTRLSLLSAVQKRQVIALLSVEVGGLAPEASGSSRVSTATKVAVGQSVTVPPSSRGKSSGKKRRGNPQRKSQYATNPLYIEYARLRKVVQKQAKEAKIAFNAVTSPEKQGYDLAFTRWVEAKSSFRRYTTDEEISGSQTAGKRPRESETRSGGSEDRMEDESHDSHSASDQLLVPVSNVSSKAEIGASGVSSMRPDAREFIPTSLSDSKSGATLQPLAMREKKKGRKARRRQEVPGARHSA